MELSKVLYIVNGPMEFLLDTDTLEVLWTSDTVMWDGYDQFNMEYVWKNSLGFTKLNPGKTAYQTI